MAGFAGGLAKAEPLALISRLVNMDKRTKNGLVGLGMLALGTGLAAAGVVLVAPVCVAYSKQKLKGAYEKGKAGLLNGIESAAGALQVAADKADGPLSDAARAAKQGTAIAAGAIETAAHYIKERVQ